MKTSPQPTAGRAHSARAVEPKTWRMRARPAACRSAGARRPRLGMPPIHRSAVVVLSDAVLMRDALARVLRPAG